MAVLPCRRVVPITAEEREDLAGQLAAASTVLGFGSRLIDPAASLTKLYDLCKEILAKYQEIKALIDELSPQMEELRAMLNLQR